MRPALGQLNATGKAVQCLHAVLPRRLAAPRQATGPHAPPGCSRQVHQQTGSCCQAQMEAQASKPAQQQGQQKQMIYTHFGANSWQLELPNSGLTVLVDPWLTGELTFAGQNWAFEGRKGLDPPLDIDAIAAKADLMLLSQGLPDHSHKPTLERLPKSLPVVGSPAAARVAAGMGFKQVYELDHGESMQFCKGKLEITGTIGALVGPPWSKRENGFVIRETSSPGIKIYYEPHCDYDEKSTAPLTDLDVVITPACSQLIAGYPLVQGSYNISRLVAQTRPKVVIPLNNSEFPSSGPISKLIWSLESSDNLPDRLEDAAIRGVRVEQAKPPGQPLELRL